VEVLLLQLLLPMLPVLLPALLPLPLPPPVPVAPVLLVELALLEVLLVGGGCALTYRARTTKSPCNKEHWSSTLRLSLLTNAPSPSG
jgi:hypothetical protein